MNIVLVVVLSVVSIGLNGVLSIGQGAVLLIPTLFCIAIIKKKWVDVLLLSNVLLLSQFFTPLPGIFYISLVGVAFGLGWMTGRFINERSFVMPLAVIFGFIPILLLTGFRDLGSIVGSLIWVIVVVMAYHVLTSMRTGHKISGERRI